MSFGQLTTSDASAHVLFTCGGPLIARDGAVFFRLVIGGAATDGSRAVYVREFLVKSIAGALSLVGSVASPVTIEDVAGWDVTVAVASNVLTVSVTGDATRTVTWGVVNGGSTTSLPPFDGSGPSAPWPFAYVNP